mmetsp:Transcript_24916/g.50622  ORF Transcript_24916/g.50622 Transcript_24916/m.50622 type:complete len:385 (+) Transcript_24916:70-1224(+)
MEGIEMYLSIVGTVAALVIGYVMYTRLTLQVAAPNEWMLVIRDGKLHKAGVGLRWAPGLNDTVVKFPASIFKLTFSAQQITKEMQGVEVTGFVMWTIFRDEEGPFRAYRSFNGLTSAGIDQANENLRNLTESIIRAQIANMDITDVVANREMMRDNVRKQASPLVQGWGVWMETIEVTDVKILSSSLFSNLQAKFREEMRSKAELLKMSNNKSIEEEKTKVSLEMNKLQVDSDNQKAQYRANEELKTQQNNEKLMQEKTRIQESELALQGKLEEAQELQRRKMAMTREETSRLVEVQQQQTRDTMQQMAAEAEAKAFKTKMEAQQCMSETNLKVLSLETSKQIYNQMESMKVLHVSGGGGGGDGVEKMVPGLVAMQQALTMAKD